MTKRTKSRTREPKNAPAPYARAESFVIGARYCLRCGKLCLSIALGVNEAVTMRGVGSVTAPCCQAQTALVLLPYSGAGNPRVPNLLPIPFTGYIGEAQFALAK